MIDSHCHLYLCREPVGDILERAHEHGLTDIVQVATDCETAIWGKDLAEQLSHKTRIHPTVGLYPSRADGPWQDQMETLNRELSSGAYVALGEMGIDLYHDQSFLEAQLEMFHAQIPLALEHNLPMILHIRNSYEEVKDALSDYQGDPHFRGVWHCFEGTLEQALHFVEMDWMISFSGLLSYKNREDLREVAKALPLSKIMIETDSPYLSPVPLRHEKNEPWKVGHVLHCLAESRGMDPNELEKIIDDNTLGFFGLETT